MSDEYVRAMYGVLPPEKDDFLDSEKERLRNVLDPNELLVLIFPCLKRIAEKYYDLPRTFTNQKNIEAETDRVLDFLLDRNNCLCKIHDNSSREFMIRRTFITAMRLVEVELSDDNSCSISEILEFYKDNHM